MKSIKIALVSIWGLNHAMMHPEIIPFKLLNNLKNNEIEYAPLGTAGTPPNDTLLGAGGRALPKNSTFTTEAKRTFETNIDNSQKSQLLFKIKGDATLYLYEFTPEGSKTAYVRIVEGPAIEPQTSLGGKIKGNIEQGSIKKLNYRAPESAPQQAQKATPQQTLFRAVQAGNVSEAQKALQARANVNATEANGATPLMLAAQSGNVQMIQALLQAGADIDAKNYKNKDMTALMFATQSNQKDAVKALLDAGANVMATSADERRAINYATDLATKSMLLKAEQPKPKVPQAPAGAPQSYAPGKTTIIVSASERIEVSKKAIQNELADLNANLARADISALRSRYDVIMNQFNTLKSFLGSPANRTWAQNTNAQLSRIRTTINKRIADEKAAAIQEIPQAPALDIPQAPPLDAVPVIPQAPPLAPSAQQAIPQAPPMGSASGSVAAARPAPAAPSMAPAPARPSTPVQSQSPDLLKEIQAGKGLRKVSDQEKQQTRKSDLEKGLAKQRAAIAGDEDDEEEVVDKEAMAKEQAAIDKLAIEIYNKFSQEYKGRITKDIAQTIAKKLSRQGDQNLNNARVQTWVKKEIAELAPLQGGQAGGIGLGGIKVPEYLKKSAQESEDWD